MISASFRLLPWFVLQDKNAVPKSPRFYIRDSWIKILTEKPFEIHQAAADSQKIMDYLMAFDRKREQKQQEEWQSGTDRTNHPENKELKEELEPTLKIGR